MAKRFQDAIFIQAGACNPSGIALTLHNACKECIAEGVSQREDAAVRLIAHQLAYLLNIREIDEDVGMVYARLTRECEAKVDAERVRDIKLQRLVTVPLTRAQREALKAVYERGPVTHNERTNRWGQTYVSADALWNEDDEPRLSYRAFRKLAMAPVREGDPVMVPWCGMWLGIEPDGYTHS